MSNLAPLPAALRRCASAALVLALLLLPILSHGALAHSTLDSAGILCSQSDDGNPAPKPNRHEDCALSCAVTHAQILPRFPSFMNGPVAGLLRRAVEPKPIWLPVDLRRVGYIRGPPAGLIA